MIDVLHYYYNNDNCTLLSMLILDMFKYIRLFDILWNFYILKGSLSLQYFILF